MALPKAIQQQVEELDRIQEELGKPTPPAGAPAEPDQGQAQVVTEPVAQEPPPAPQQPAPTVEPWEQRYKTLKGMYDADVPRLHQQVKALTEQVNNLTQRPAQHTATPEKKLVTDKDKEAFGEDLLDLIARSVDERTQAYRSREESLRAEIAELKGQLTNVSEKQGLSQREQFFAVLNQEVPNWEQVNQDPAYHAWLLEPDPVFGVPRQEALNQASNALNGPQTAKIFKSFLATQKAPAPAPVPADPTKELQRQVAPRQTRSGPAPQSQVKPIYTQEQIASFYDNWRRGLLDQNEALQFEAEINAALTEGRIR